MLMGSGILRENLSMASTIIWAISLLSAPKSKLINKIINDKKKCRKYQPSKLNKGLNFYVNFKACITFKYIDFTFENVGQHTK